MEHLRWEAIQEGAFGLGYLFSGGAKMVVRAQDLILGPAAIQGMELELSIVLAHVGTTSITFAHEARRASDGKRIASSTVVAVAVDSAGRPTRVPDVVRAHVESVELTTPLGFDEPAPDTAHMCPLAVRPSDLDTLQHVNQSRYVDFVDDVRELSARENAYGEASQRALSFPRRIAIDYRRETRFGHDLMAYTWALDAPRGVFAFELRDAVDADTVACARIVTGG
jgi:acyl-CoA thioesterase FadM